jgi:hypothetical protein
MAYRIEFGDATGRATGTLSGSVSGEEYAEAVCALYGDAAWTPGADVLWDLSAIRELLVDQRGVDAIVDAVRACQPKMGGGRVAVVIPNEMHRTIASLLMYKTRWLERERRLFEARAAAEAWLDGGHAPGEAAGV